MVKPKGLEQATILLARHLGGLAHATRLHDVGNAAISRMVTWCTQDLNSLAARFGEARVELDGGILFVNGAAVRANRDLRGHFMTLDDRLRAHGAGGFKLRGPLEGVAMISMFRGFNEVPSGVSRERFQHWLDQNGAQVLELLPPRQLVAGAVGGAGHSVRTAAASALRIYVQAAGAIDEAMMKGQVDHVPPRLFRSVEAVADLALDEPRQLQSLMALREDIEPSVRHPLHTAIVAAQLGAAVGLTREVLVDLSLAAVIAAAAVHGSTLDGRVAAASALVATPRMTGVRARRMLTIYQQDAASDKNSHLYARIVAIAREFDRLTNQDIDHAALLPDEALARMQVGAFDRELVTVLARNLGRYPVGTPVRLSSGEVGIVFYCQADPTLSSRPVVKVRTAERPEGQLIDLAARNPDGTWPRSIVETIDPAMLGQGNRSARSLFT